MATYNGAAYLEEQLESFLAQTRQPDELIVSDDCSIDNTEDIIFEFARTAPFKVKFYRTEKNLGYSANFNAALLKTTGDLVFLSDQDDVWLPHKIEKICSFFNEKKDACLVIHDIEFCKDDLTPVGQTKINRMNILHSLNRDYVVGMATAVRRDFLDLCLPIPEEQGIAYDSWLHHCANIISCKYILNDVLSLHRRHSANQTREKLYNVDFKLSYFSYHLKTISSILNEKPSLPDPNLILLNWLENKRDQLVCNKFLTTESYIKSVENEKKRVESYYVRKKLLNLPRHKRFKYILLLVRSGGYKYFRSWKSILRDLFLK